MVTTGSEFTVSNKKKLRVSFYGILFVSLISSIGFWFWNENFAETERDAHTNVVQVVSAEISCKDVPVRLVANGIVTPKQMVDMRPQTSATIEVVHITEGQFVRKGDRLFTLDARSAEANHNKAEAQLAKSRADLANAERQLERHRELFEKGFISQAALDKMLSQVDSLRGQFGFDQAAVEAKRVARSFTEIVAPISGRTGAISVHSGSLVMPSDPAMVSITQIDPIQVSFALPEREFSVVQQALRKGRVPVSALLGQSVQQGFITFVDNVIDTASGTIRLKAEFSNPDNQLWPGMYVKVMLTPRVLTGVFTVPVQAVQTGPEKNFLYVIDKDHQVIFQPVHVRLIQDGLAVIEGEGIAPGVRIVVEGAQNLRPGSVVSESVVYDNAAHAGGEFKNWPDQKPDWIDSIKNGLAVGMP